jgi:hypothetical protein
MKVRVGQVDFKLTFKAFLSPAGFFVAGLAAAFISPFALVTWFLYETSSTRAALWFAFGFATLIGVLRATYMAGAETLIVRRYRTIDLGDGDSFDKEAHY